MKGEIQGGNQAVIGSLIRPSHLLYRRVEEGL